MIVDESLGTNFTKVGDILNSIPEEEEEKGNQFCVERRKISLPLEQNTATLSHFRN